MKTILLVAGTRPEAIKLAPLVKELRSREGFEVKLCATAQHRHMLDQVLETFELQADFDLDLMSPNQTLPQLTSRLFAALPQVLEEARPDCVVVQGDTTSAFAGALSAYYQKLRVAHVEAGLRTGNPYAPFPEEMNRRLITPLARWHFAPTQAAKENLLAEAVPEWQIHVTGNTVIDALLSTARRAAPLPEALRLEPGQKLVVVTGHRRESFGGGIENVCQALLNLARNHSELRILYAVHPNPNVRKPVEKLLGAVPNIRLIEPPDYVLFVALMREAYFLITDSGGVQEEAPALGKPVLVTRDTTERPEAVQAGCACLVGTNTQAILAQAEKLLNDPQAYQRMACAGSPFGDGQASRRIAQVLEQEL